MLPEPLAASRERENGGRELYGRPARERTLYEPLAVPPAPQIRKQMRADEALQLLGRHQLGRMLAAHSGVVLDLHPEHVHDFRVAVRRTRSLIGQLRSVLLDSVQSHFDTEFRWLAGCSGPTRDADVLIEALDTYAEWVSPEARPGLGALRAHVSVKRRNALQALVRDLETDRYRRLVREWQAFLAAPLPFIPQTEIAGRRIESVARDRVSHKSRRIFAQRDKVDARTSPLDLHRLRIEFKKLRYLVEFFSDLTPKRSSTRAIAELKKIQDRLGTINDRRVNRAALLEIACSSDVLAQEPLALVATGEILRALTERIEDDAQQFADLFRRFTRKKNRRRYAALL